ncbi:hypothetical protein NDU88_008946 [Pleurodeles waltl]|uniref:Uncharacterized protein n=1 Tax=Pleurodeles waltl TaxID=8319 RepID=A0AAV7N851_PLEWA|nr:hypothetical protein NDU88_008946 [Pleurodeles waltl]
MSSLGPGNSSVLRGSDLQYCPGGPTIKATTSLRAPIAPQIRLTSPLCSRMPQAEAQCLYSRTVHGHGGLQRGPPTAISISPLGAPPGPLNSTGLAPSPHSRAEPLCRLDIPAQASAPSRALPAATLCRLVGTRTEALACRGSPAQQDGHRAAFAGPARRTQYRII